MVQSVNAPPRFAFLDVFRGVGILIVLLFHASIEVSGHAMFWQGWHWDPGALDPARGLLQLLLQWLQVPTAFFVVSGFLMHQSRQRSRAPMQAFLVRRGLRLYLPYLAALFFFGALYAPTRMPPTSLPNVMQIATHLGMVFNLHDVTLWPINPSFWYIATEVQLCLLYPLVVLGTRRFGWQRVLLALAIVEIASHVASTRLDLTNPDGVPLTLGDNWMARNAFAYCFAWGLGAWVAEKHARGTLARPGRWQLIGWPLLALAATLCRYTTVMATSLVALAVAAGLSWLVVRSATRPDGNGARVSWTDREIVPPLRFLGAISLGIYLFNQPLMRDVVLQLRPHFADQFALILAATLVTTAIVVPLAWAFTHCVEAPLIRFAMRRLDAPVPRGGLAGVLHSAKPDPR